jgi:hypothetical protein
MVPSPKKGKRVSPYELERRRLSPVERTIHELNNLFGALRLRLDILTRDATCVWAQGDNLEAASRILDDAMVLATRLEAKRAALKLRRRSSR